MILNKFAACAVTCVAAACSAWAGAASPLFSRGYTVIPAPQRVEFTGPDFDFASGWQLSRGEGVAPGDVAVEVLEKDLAVRHGIRLAPGSGAARTRTVRLEISAGSVAIGDASDRDKAALAREAYRLDLSPEAITIKANAAPGLFYGATTLVQLATGGRLPQARIVDWPDLENRFLYWDDKAHLDRMDVLKEMLRQAAFFKANGVLIKLNGHFQYASAPAVVEPYALTPAEFQQLTDYGLRYHVELIPYIDGPAHIAWILKHPEYARLRAFPESNYELCSTNPDSYKLLEGMFQELMDANKGVKHFLLSTDEPYYIGMADSAQCNEASAAKQAGGPGRLLARFISRTAGYLHDRGRTVIFWGEYPLKVDDIPSLPPYLINGEVYGPAFDKAYRAHGIRQMIFTYPQANEPLFPIDYLLPSSEEPNSAGTSQADSAHFRPRQDRIAQLYTEISLWGARGTADLMGVNVCAWADEGLHPETFWLGFAAGAAWSWHPGTPGPDEAKSSFYRLFYGRGASSMDRLYQLMSTQARFWDSSWEWAPSSFRPPLFGNSRGIRPIAPRDQTMSLPPLPRGEYLRLDYDWEELNRRKLQLTEKSLAENDELLGLLGLNMQQVQFHRYNLDVFLSIARLCRQNLEMLELLREAGRSLRTAEGAAARLDYAGAAAALDQALDLAFLIRAGRNQALRDATATWYESWFPRVAEANGRRHLQVLNTVHDYRVDRTLGLNYIIQREFLLPVGEWVGDLLKTRNTYAAKHHLAPRSLDFDWQDDTTTARPQSY